LRPITLWERIKYFFKYTHTTSDSYDQRGYHFETLRKYKLIAGRCYITDEKSTVTALPGKEARRLRRRHKKDLK